MSKRFAIGLMLAMSPSIASADDLAKIVGSWRIVSSVIEDIETKERRNNFGEKPSGFIIFTREGRMVSIATGEGRKVPQNDEDRAAAYRSMLAFTGKYRLEGDKFIVKVDASWFEGWKGTEQVRLYKIEGDKLQMFTAPFKGTNLFPGRMTRGIVLFEREK